jgi:hypothetical protein
MQEDSGQFPKNLKTMTFHINLEQSLTKKRAFSGDGI